MLEHREEQPPNLTPLSAAAQQRVTPEELTAALAALEASKEEEARRLRGTLPLGEAVQDLGLDATPEDIWREVEAQRARKEAAPPPPLAGARLAETIKETLHAAAQQAHELAGQAAQARSEAHSVRKRRTGGGVFGIMIALAVVGSAWFSSVHGLMVNSDHAHAAYSGGRGAAVVTGDYDTITLTGDCKTLTVLGDHNQITMTGKVHQITAWGDKNTIRWVPQARGQVPSVTDNGDGNRIEPVSGAALPLPTIPATPPVPESNQ